MAQGYNARLDDALGARHGKKSQSMRARRHESEGMRRSLAKPSLLATKSLFKNLPVVLPEVADEYPQP